MHQNGLFICSGQLKFCLFKEVIIEKIKHNTLNLELAVRKTNATIYVLYFKALISAKNIINNEIEHCNK